ncbi:MAG: DUF1588 domain-containing protein, partial [Pseudomonadota bacterium]
GRGGVNAGRASTSNGGGVPSFGASDGPTGYPSVGGATGGIAGPAMPAPGVSYCGTSYQTPPAPQFATPQVVWKRIQLFLAPTESGSPTLPAVTTRQWAGDLAMSVLDSLGNNGAPGMERFVSSWLPGTPIASTWAAFFSVKGATLTDLLTTNVIRNPGSGILTDDAALNRGDIIEISARGAFLRSRLLCQTVPPPPPSVVTHAPIGPGQTRRQALQQHGANAICAGCHALMDPLGYALDHFDDLGVYSDVDNGSPIDSSGSIGLNAGTISFDGANQLGAQLAKQCEVTQCVALQMLADAENSAALPVVVDPETAFDPQTGTSVDPNEVASIAAALHVSKGDLRTLIRLVVQSDTFLRASQ